MIHNTIITIEEGLYCFNYESFMERQKQIMLKFKLSNTYDFEVLDKYLFQIVEEVQEVMVSKDDTERLEELIDVLMYLGSTISYIMETNDYIQNDKMILIRPINYDLTIEEFTRDLFIKVNQVRRLFPERKWHKSHNDPRQKIYDELGIERESLVITSLKFILINILEYLISYYKTEEICFKLRHKQNFIISL